MTNSTKKDVHIEIPMSDFRKIKLIIPPEGDRYASLAEFIRTAIREQLKIDVPG